MPNQINLQLHDAILLFSITGLVFGGIATYLRWVFITKTDLEKHEKKEEMKYSEIRANCQKSFCNKIDSVKEDIVNLKNAQDIESRNRQSGQQERLAETRELYQKLGRIDEFMRAHLKK